MPGKSLKELAAIVEGIVHGDEAAVITGAAPIEDASPGDITFAADRKYFGLLSTTRASAAVVPEGADSAPGSLNLIVVKNPQLAFARIVEVLRPLELPGPGVHPKAEVHHSARLGSDVSVQAFSVIEEGAVVGERTVIFPGVYIGKGAAIGSDCVIYPGVSIREGCILGDRVMIHSNAVIGSDGFGYARDSVRYVKVPQRGIVRIGDDVEIGASAAIDRAALGETSIGRGTKIDNLVHIAHNVRIGEDSALAAQTGIAGSTKIGSRTQFGGQVGVSGHLNVGDDVGIGAKSGVVQDVPSKSVCSGIPAIPHMDWLKAQNIYAKLPELKKKIAELERRLAEIEIRADLKNKGEL